MRYVVTWLLAAAVDTALHAEVTGAPRAQRLLEFLDIVIRNFCGLECVLKRVGDFLDASYLKALKLRDTPFLSRTP